MRLNFLSKLTLARNLLATDKITASCKTNISPKASYETVANKQDERNWKTLRLTRFQRPQLQSVLSF